MKKVFYKILSVLMAFVVMLTTMSFTVDMHYCGDSLVDFSFFTKAESCGMEKAQPVKCENPAMSKKSCCSDQKIVKEGSDDLKTSFTKLTFEQQTFVATFFYTYINLFEGLDENIVPFKDYSPPFIERDVQILYETYLI
ncbi:HYC_CC_PP family protein [Leeuwenhoekiella palythoae]|uniref:HYC_CC_PP family protein n=1 Tax=Leeuwenhoekiella palythoae TaxID=573501 RepID=UPI003F7D3F2D|tara:strand:+ start:996 stop:1412 length:417 start_codon:yes stop_codon:yes gene_type:complete